MQRIGKMIGQHVRLCLCLTFMLVGFAISASLNVTAQSEDESAPALILDDHTRNVRLDHYLDIIFDASRMLKIEDLASSPDKWSKWEGAHSFSRPNLGYTSGNYWFRITIDNRSDRSEWFLELDSPKLNVVHLYTWDHTQQSWTQRPIGTNFPFAQRDVHHRNFVYTLNLQPGLTETIYIGIRTGSSVQVPLTIWEPSVFSEKIQTEYTLFGLFIGVSLVMALYHLFLYFSLRSRSYLYYVVFVLVNTLLSLADTGLGYQFIWNEQTLWNSRSVSSLMMLANLGGLLFATSFLETKRYAPRLDTSFRWMIGVTAVVMFVRLQELYLHAYDWTFINLFILFIAIGLTLATLVLITVAAIQSVRRGYRPARYFLLAWSVFTAGALTSLFTDTGLLPLNFVTKYAWQITSMTEMLLLSLALADRIRLIAQQKEAAERQAKENHELALNSLRQANELKDEFLANTSHELQTPLYGIIGIAETVREGVAGPISPTTRQHLGMIIDSGKRLSALIQDILDYAKLKHHELELRRQPVDMRSIADLVLAVCQPLVRHRPITLINDIPADLPAAWADENRVQQILYNLIGNAIKHTTAGEIRLSATAQSKSLFLSVSDTGAGIPLDQQELIFEWFHQGQHGDARQTAGTGIGLNITKKLVELHGGSLTLVSEPDQGATFTFTLPVSSEVERESWSAPQAQPRFEAAASTEPLPLTAITRDSIAKPAIGRVLLVDDESVNLQVMYNHLSLVGYEVATAGSGSEALALIQQTSQSHDGSTFDLLILDIMMPQMSGYEVCLQLRQQFSMMELPILMLTAKNQIKDRLLAFEAGANDYVTKPCDHEELLARVDTLIHLRRLHLDLLEMNRQLESRVEARTHELENANQSLLSMAASRRHLLANISHELGTPITLINSYVQAAIEGVISADEPHYLQMVAEKVSVLDRLTQDLFELSKLEARQGKFVWTYIHTTDWMHTVLERCRYEIVQSGRKFVPPEVESLARLRPYRSRIDQERMSQVITNLLSNAIKFTAADTGRVMLCVEVQEQPAALILSFVDNGVGLEPAEVEAIFERFYRAKSGEDIAGTGLGLVISREIISQHGGRIWAESTLGSGSTFKISLPLYK